MNKIAKTEYEDLIANVFACAAGTMSAKDNEVAAELKRLHKAVDRLLGCEPHRMTGSLATRRSAAVLSGYGAISSATVRIGRAATQIVAEPKNDPALFKIEPVLGEANRFSLKLVH